MGIPHWIECTRCGWRRAIVPTAPATPANRAADWREAQSRALRLSARSGCPECGDVDVVAVERDAFGRIAR